MIEPTQGNLLRADVEALVNTVNCVGFMGKGIALQFKKAFPRNFLEYQRACRAEEVRPGRILVHETGTLSNPRYILNFPTKRHWRGHSLIEDIRSGLVALVAEIERRGIRSVAVPPLGCGNGGLDWEVVRPLILEAFSNLPKVRVLLFEPAGFPAAADQPIGTTRPAMTTARALFVKAMDEYTRGAYRLTLLEIQKLAYFLQEAGEPLRLRFEEGHYGPYAANLNKVLERLEGHFTQGYSDSPKPDVEIALLPEAVTEADAWLANESSSVRHLERVVALIDGFETPFGMELLASVHWVATHGEERAGNPQEALSKVQAWNDRKRRLFQEEHVILAWEHLDSEGWLPASGSI